jgi:hypothetical protein
LTYFTALANSDNVELRLNSVPITMIFHNLIANVVTLAQKNKEFALEFIKGYEAGDGSINVRKGCLHDINITVKDAKMKDVLKRLFNLLYDIKLNERKTHSAYEIWYSDINTITKFIVDGHFRDHKLQWEKLLNAYSRKEYTRSHIRYWQIINNRALSILEIAKFASRSHWSVRDALNKDEMLDIVSCEMKKGRNGYSYKTYKLKDSGMTVLDNLIEVGILDQKTNFNNGGSR